MTGAFLGHFRYTVYITRRTVCVLRTESWRDSDGSLYTYTVHISLQRCIHKQESDNLQRVCPGTLDEVESRGRREREKQ